LDLKIDKDYLLRRLEEARKQREQAEKPKTQLTSVEVFINELGVKVGNDIVPNYVIYYYYKSKWQSTRSRYTRIHFFRVFSKYFKSYRIGKQRSYLLDKEQFDGLTDEVLRRAQRYDKIEKERERKRFANLKRGKKKQEVPKTEYEP
jgi:hypothetical protein